MATYWRLSNKTLELKAALEAVDIKRGETRPEVPLEAKKHTVHSWLGHGQDDSSIVNSPEKLCQPAFMAISGSGRARSNGRRRPLPRVFDRKRAVGNVRH
jgi:hypothetical protein